MKTCNLLGIQVQVCDLQVHSFLHVSERSMVRSCSSAGEKTVNESDKVLSLIEFHSS